MKRVCLCISIVCAVSLMVSGKIKKTDDELPALHVITNAVLSPSYGCRSGDEFKKGYWTSALFISGRRNGPDLLFNGACGPSEDFFSLNFGGDDMSLIADLGANVLLVNVSAHRAFNIQNLESGYSKFVRVANVELNHTYVVLRNESAKRALFVFTVTGYIPNKKVELEYVVKSYELMPNGRISAPGFDWTRENTR